MSFNFKFISITDMKQAVQDNIVILHKDNIYSLCGFCCGINVSMCPPKYRKKISKKTSHKRGFIKEIYKYNIKDNKWFYLKDLDIIPRQGQRSFLYNNKIFLLGGYSYKPLTIQEIKEYKVLPSKKNIYTYNDGIVYDIINDNLVFNKKILLPFNITNSSFIQYKNYLYLINGCIYDTKSFNNNYKVLNRNIEYGKLFLRFKIINNDLILDETKISSFRGTSRFNSISFLYNNCIYVLNGCNCNEKINNSKGYNEYTYCNVIDNWKYDILSDKWIQLNNSPNPIVGQGWVMYKKYIIMIGCASYNNTIINNKLISTKNIIKKNNKFKFNNISSISNNYKNKDTCSNQYNQYFSNMIIIYDIINDEYHTSDYALCMNINGAKLLIKDEILYILAGECNPILLNNTYYGNHLGGMIKLKIFF